MTSLVAYEDSDSGDELVSEERTGHPNARSDFVAGRSRGGRTQFGLSSSVRNRPSPVPKMAASKLLTTRREEARASFHDGGEAVRPQAAEAGPARGREVSPTLNEGVTDQDREQDQDRERVGSSKLLTEVSDSVRPYLGTRCSGAELPRRVRLRFQAHQGPVNAIQWCPVPHLSHLLLSASMDGTAKVWDGTGSGQSLRTCSSHGGAVRDACWTPCGRRLLTGSFDTKVKLTDVETGE
ncbi:hypothetical protein AAFF_G00047990 [Aldrovandia affinis]|uniref:Uncharacterized protein n=1 Tax=Aldrovandia affinis TaxID=143900 RepID=A0AAD7S1G1_9TELE|nr:hypothetical protein AAFF_G00047990 [Aldrovandia affinis]